MQAQMYGTDHYYNTDLFNEEVPPSNSTTYLASISKATYAAMAAVRVQVFFTLRLILSGG